jgi:ribosomal protein S18 acetylase RimI-like enzyme
MEPPDSAHEAVRIDGPSTEFEGLAELEQLWRELHLHHREVCEYTPLVDDLDESWSSRRRLYHRLLKEGGAYFVARDTEERVVGYAFCEIVPGPDDTFLVQGGLVELVSLVVAANERGRGVGQRLVQMVERMAAERGFDTVRIAVMAGNDGARRFYEAAGYRPAELVLYRRLPD